jgi:protein TonB
VAGGVSGGVGGGVSGGVVGGVPGSEPSPLDPAAVRVGGDIKPPARLVNVPPVYPEDAKAANVQGVVIADIVVDTDGTVVKTRILRSIPMLDQAALDAIQQWTFTPTRQNGTPVKVIMTVTVNFTLR